MRSILLSFFLIACNSLPTIPELLEPCKNLDFESGVVERNGEYQQYRQEEFLFQYMIDRRATAEIINGQVAWSTDSVTFQWFTTLPENNMEFFHDFISIDIFADSMGTLTFVGDDFDTLRVSQPGHIVIPGTLFRGTTQVHAWCNAKNFRVDNVAVCTSIDSALVKHGKK